MNLTLSGLAATQQELATINALYENYLSRDAETAGLQNWATALDGGMSMTEIARQIATSQEAQMQHAAAVTYQAPAAQQPAYQQPVYQQPAYQQPAVQAQNYVDTSVPQSMVPPASGGINQKTLMIAGLALGAIVLTKRKKKG
jgi:hypothetical protein